jgi:hypothetical protein
LRKLLIPNGNHRVKGLVPPSANLPLEKVPVNPRRLDASRIIRPGAVHR